MICEDVFTSIMERARGYKYSSMNYIDFDACKNAEILYDNDMLILLQDKSKLPSILYFATNNFEEVVHIIAKMSGKLRLHFVPKAYAEQLKELNFIEWGEYADFWNINLSKTAAQFKSLDKPEYLSLDECEEASIVTKSCMGRSRGFEGAPLEFYEEWLNEGNQIIIGRIGMVIVGVCCVAIYNEGTTLWIKEFAVDPKHQGIGLGKKLLEQAINYGIQYGATKGFLLADVLNENAIGLYKKYGFEMKDDESELQMVRQ